MSTTRGKKSTGVVPKKFKTKSTIDAIIADRQVDTHGAFFDPSPKALWRRSNTTRKYKSQIFRPLTSHSHFSRIGSG